ncbi:MAG TPA: alginate lyase family protein [Anaerolineales bacterium]|nr:alginate lyase family protein [Anaerolineales bacterium]
MLTRLRAFASLYRELGPRWSAFRLAYAFRLRTGLIRLQMPQYKWEDRPLASWLRKHIPSNPEAYVAWRKSNTPKFLFERSVYPDDVPWSKQTPVAEADRLLAGEMKYFAHNFHHTGYPPKWHVVPISLLEATGIPFHVNGAQGMAGGAESDRHWSRISHDGEIDIKFIWEPSRFAFVYTLVRAYAATRDEKYAEAFWDLVEDWAKHNPPNTGPNWMDGQEIALRLMAWMFGYHQFYTSPSATPQRIARFTHFVAAQADRIYQNITYAISTRSNHTISEAAGLWLVGLLFPELKDSEKYLSLGHALLEQEAAAQIFPDGSYAMYSLNYHRFILHIFLLVMRLAELNNILFSQNLYRSISNSMDFLYELIDPTTGQAPLYGSNDGALVLPLNNCDFTDYRPILQLGAHMTQGVTLFPAGDWDEDIFWFFGRTLPHNGTRQKKANKIGFPDGGVYILRSANSRAILRCTAFCTRPSHADQLHMDLWLGSQNIACDAGTYLYSGKGIWRNGLAHTAAHNTVLVDDKDQMTLVSRFTWTNWAKGRVLEHTANLWQGEHDGYKPVLHKRTVKALGDDRWLVVDSLTANEPHHYALHWLLGDFPFEQQERSVLLWLNGTKYKVQVGLRNGNGNFSLIRANPASTRGWRSRYYAHKEPALSLMLETHQPVACFWTFFGFDEDVIEAKENVLIINSIAIHLQNEV